VPFANWKGKFTREIPLMSLINDALKRAKQSQQPAPPAGAQPLPPIEAEPPRNVGWLFPLLVALLIGAACFFIGVAFFAIRKPAVQITPPIPAPQKTQTAAIIVPAPPKTPLPATTQTVVVSTPQKTVPPVLKVQGIFYNAVKPEAIVNGMTVFAGDNVNGFRVKLISKTNISFIAPDGTEKTLALGE
jgi:hypothetical protein